MHLSRTLILALTLATAGLAASIQAQTDAGTPHLKKQGSATQLVVDGSRS